MRALIALAVAACAPGCVKLPTCTTLAECKALDGKRVDVVGVYSVWDPLPDRPPSHPPARQVLLELGGGDGAFLGAWGREGHMRELREIERFRGKRVRVTGTFRSVMPPHPTDPPEAASLSGPCVYPVDRIAAE